MLMPDRLFASLAVLALTGCGGHERDAAADTEGLPRRALSAPVMIDPELALRDDATAAIAGGGPGVVEVPPFEHDAETLAAARAEALKLAGTRIAAAPSPSDGGDSVLRDAVTAVQRARAVKGPGSDCGGKADYAMAWSLRLPAAFPIYPRGHLLEAAGSDSDQCRLRVVRFVTPVAPDEVIAFYYTRARAAKLAARYMATDGVHQLSGSNATGAFAVQARKRDDGMTETDIVVNGG